MDLQEIFSLYRITSPRAETVESALGLKRYAPDELILNETEVPEYFYLLREGEALVTKKNREGEDDALGIMEPGDFFGEIGILENSAATVTVKAIDAAEVYQVDREVFGVIFQNNPDFAGQVQRIAKNRLLQLTPIFKNLDDPTLLQVQKLLQEQSFAAGEVVFRENDMPDALYLIVKGSVNISKQGGDGKEIPLAHFGQGELFGEMGLIETQLRSATVTAAEPVKLLRLSQEDFLTLLQQNSAISFNMLKLLSKRFRDK